MGPDGRSAASEDRGDLGVGPAAPDPKDKHRALLDGQAGEDVEHLEVIGIKPLRGRVLTLPPLTTVTGALQGSATVHDGGPQVGVGVIDSLQAPENRREGLLHRVLSVVDTNEGR